MEQHWRNWDTHPWELWRSYRGHVARCGRYGRRTEAEAAKGQLAKLWGGWSLEIRYVGANVYPSEET
jgi:hypothetical protein